MDTNGFGLVPFADGNLHGIALQRHGRVFVFALVLLRFRAFHQKDVALMIVPALHLHALRPDFIGRLDVDEDAGVVGLGRDFDEAPADGEEIIAVNLRGAEVAGRRAGAVDDPVRDAPGLERIGVGLGDKRPAGEIFLVEQRDGHFMDARRVNQILILRADDGTKNLEQNEGGDEFHGFSVARKKISSSADEMVGLTCGSARWRRGSAALPEEIMRAISARAQKPVLAATRANIRR